MLFMYPLYSFGNPHWNVFCQGSVCPHTVTVIVLFWWASSLVVIFRPFFLMHTLCTCHPSLCVPFNELFHCTSILSSSVVYVVDISKCSPPRAIDVMADMLKVSTRVSRQGNILCLIHNTMLASISHLGPRILSLFLLIQKPLSSSHFNEKLLSLLQTSELLLKVTLQASFQSDVIWCLTQPCPLAQPPINTVVPLEAFGSELSPPVPVRQECCVVCIDNG